MDDSFKLNVHKFRAELDKGLFFESNIPQGFGLGSSGALVAAIFLRYLDKAGDFKDEMKMLSQEKIRGLKATLGKMEGFFHGTSSGIDPLSILINKPLLVRSSFDVSPVQLPEAKEDGRNIVFLLNTGLPRETETLVGKFKEACESNTFKKKLENELTVYTNDGINSFLNADTPNMYYNLYSLIKFQLDEMDYIFPEAYAKLAKEGISTGDYFLKVCGAGGGGYMLGFTENWEATQAKLKDHKLEILYRF
jgi:mevalonate kinase